MGKRNEWCCERHAERVQVMNEVMADTSIWYADRAELGSMLMYGECTVEEGRELHAHLSGSKDTFQNPMMM